MLNRWGDFLRADLLKVGHHGSDTSSSQLFLNQVLPKIAVMQVGADNHYGLPDARAINRFKKIGTQILRNDLNGDVCLETTGVDFKKK